MAQQAPLDRAAFAQSIRQKYQDYHDVPDDDVIDAWLEVHPEDREKFQVPAPVAPVATPAPRPTVTLPRDFGRISDTALIRQSPETVAGELQVLDKVARDIENPFAAAHPKPLPPTVKVPDHLLPHDDPYTATGKSFLSGVALGVVPDALKTDRPNPAAEIQAAIRSKLGRPCRIATAGDRQVTCRGVEITSARSANFIEFATQAGEINVLS